MKLRYVWAIAAAAVFFLAAYFALTVGTRFFLPPEWETIEVGDTYYELTRSLPVEWRDRTRLQRRRDKHPLWVAPDRWGEWTIDAAPNRSIPGRAYGMDIIGDLGFSTWRLEVILRDESVIERRTVRIDWHQKLVSWISRVCEDFVEWAKERK